MPARKNKRKHFRVVMPIPLCAKTTIISINNTPVKTGSTRICVHDMSAGGLLFSTNLSLPVSPSILYMFQFEIYHKNISLMGYIVRTTPGEYFSNRYGVKFVNMDESTCNNLSKILNLLDIRIKQGIKLNSCHFCQNDNLQCWSRIV